MRYNYHYAENMKETDTSFLNIINLAPIVLFVIHSKWKNEILLWS